MKYTQKTFDKAEAVLSQRRKDSNAAASAFTPKCPRSKRLKTRYKARILSW